ncbi:hypothetical protein GLOIN_2v1775479 [Rhizophagus irregularis DAOM 181602=DAOM 197198]|nr:hypothetical protein GLOIN_2v1775479 [Rhizophagus irregularis DAOM 181602=DAOM 197198]
MGKASSLINIIRQERDILKLRKLNIDSPISISNEINILNELSKALKTHSTFEIYKNGCKYRLDQMSFQDDEDNATKFLAFSLRLPLGLSSLCLGLLLLDFLLDSFFHFALFFMSFFRLSSLCLGLFFIRSSFRPFSLRLSLGPFRFSLYLGLFLLGPLLYIQILYSLVPYITDLEK